MTWQALERIVGGGRGGRNAEGRTGEGERGQATGPIVCWVHWITVRRVVRLQAWPRPVSSGKFHTCLCVNAGSIGKCGGVGCVDLRVVR